MSVRQVLEQQLLPRVEKPSRYLGTEVNAVHKDARAVDLRLAFVFPDLYDLGLGNLGLHILYRIVNDLPWAWAERAYSPAPDMEELLRARGLELFALESRDPLRAMDGIGFTLQSELTYTNILNALDLAGIPLRSRDRGDGDPLVFAGGPSVFNPEPLAPFMDFFVLGDGEDAIVELAELMRSLRGRSREAKLDALAGVAGVYVPERFPFDTLPDGRIVPSPDAEPVRKRVLEDLDQARFPTEYIVPFTEQVHDRLGLEVLRGCTQGCRFCQAGMTTRPVRERNVDTLGRLMDSALDETGYEEVSLVSLSTCDYSRVKNLADMAMRRARPRRTSVSLPSLRLDSFSVALADRVTDVRRSSLTFAPEAASPRLRAVINKWIPDEELLEMADEAFARGWTHLKLYFMIGLPTERDDDVQAIADLAVRTLEVARRRNRKARINLGVSTFVPKPMTPFQWAEQIDIEETRRRQRILQDLLREHKAIKFGRHDPEDSYIEGLLSRADRRAADVIERAYRLGCRFDGWSEHRRFDLWQRAVEETGFDAAAQLSARNVDERLPWDHVDILVDRQWLLDDWNRALVLEHAQDCRHSKCHKCGVIDKNRPLCAHMLRRSIKGRKEEQDFTEPPLPKVSEPPTVQRLALRVGRAGAGRFLTHHETMNAWLRALRRAKLPLSYSEGFHAHPKVAFSTAFPVGEETEADYLDAKLYARVDPSEVAATIAGVLPRGIELLGAGELPLTARALMDQVRGARYRIRIPAPADEVTSRIEELLAREQILVERRQRKKGRQRIKQVDIKPRLDELSVVERDDAGPQTVVSFATSDPEGRLVRPRDLLPLLSPCSPEDCVVRKMETLATVDEALVPLGELWQIGAVPVEVRSSA
jgi:radical SAM family uncharacterized protein/radical SAM-linked protein